MITPKNEPSPRASCLITGATDGVGKANHRILAELAKREDVTVFSAHDPVEFERLRGAGAPSAVPP